MSDLILRYSALLVLFACVGMSGYLRRRAYSQTQPIPRQREGLLVLFARLLGALLLLATVLTHIVSPSSMNWASLTSPAWLRWTGVVLGLACVYAVYWVLDSLGRNVSETVLTKHVQELITKGPYRWVRHPLYTTGITLLLAIGLTLSSWLLLVLTLIVLLLVRFLIIPREERNLVARFGEDYISYIGRSGRLLP